MKRNESILVYGVTGLLLLILLVAVVFGNEGDALAGPTGDEDGLENEIAGLVESEDGAVDLAELMNLDPASALTEGEEGDVGAPVAGEPETAEEIELAQAEAQAEAEAALARERALAGEAMRRGDYREVTVRRGDTVSLLVQRWCGSLDEMPTVEALNEDIDRDRLRPGRVLLMPWVDQAVLDLAAKERRLAENRRAAAEDEDAGTGATDAATGEQVPASSDHLYELKPGDSLWKIAVQMTGSQKRAPGYIREVMELNPDLRPQSLQVGQKVKLPLQ